MKTVKAVVLALLLWAVAACGSEPEVNLDANKGYMNKTSQGEDDDVHVLSTYHCDETTKPKPLRSSVNMVATNKGKTEITLRFMLRTHTLGSSEEGPRSLVKEVNLQPGKKTETIEQKVTPGEGDKGYALGIFKIGSDGSETQIAFTTLLPNDPCAKEGDL